MLPQSAPRTPLSIDPRDAVFETLEAEIEQSCPGRLLCYLFWSGQFPGLVKMAFALAGDVLYMILDILGDEKDYNSLFQCAISSKCFTEHSLAVLYK